MNSCLQLCLKGLRLKSFRLRSFRLKKSFRLKSNQEKFDKVKFKLSFKNKDEQEASPPDAGWSPRQYQHLHLAWPDLKHVFLPGAFLG